MRHVVFTASYINNWRSCTLEKCIQSVAKYINKPHFISISINETLSEGEKKKIKEKLFEYKNENVEIFLHHKRLTQLSHLVFLINKIKPDKITFIDDDDYFADYLPDKDEFCGLVTNEKWKENSYYPLPSLSQNREQFSGTTCLTDTFQTCLKDVDKQLKMFDLKLVYKLKNRVKITKPFVYYSEQSLNKDKDWYEISDDFSKQNLKLIEKHDYSDFIKL